MDFLCARCNEPLGTTRHPPSRAIIEMGAAGVNNEPTRPPSGAPTVGRAPEWAPVPRGPSYGNIAFFAMSGNHIWNSGCGGTTIAASGWVTPLPTM